VDFPRIIQRLKELHYQGAITIEREISGPRQEADIRQAMKYLENLIGDGSQQGENDANI